MLWLSEILYIDTQEPEVSINKKGVTALFYLSGKRDSNPRPSAWEADALPLSYSRKIFIKIPGWNTGNLNYPELFLQFISSLTKITDLIHFSKLNILTHLYHLRFMITFNPDYHFKEKCRGIN